MTNLKIKEYKNDKGLTVQQLADKAGISKRTLEDIMRRDDVLMSNIIKIANAPLATKAVVKGLILCMIIFSILQFISRQTASCSSIIRFRLRKRSVSYVLSTPTIFE